jgi:glycosyltransferase involved in cell wall biosynthesis
VRPGILHAQMEYFIFGGPGGYASVLSFLTVARRRGWRVVVTLHQVVGLKDLTRGTARGLGLTFPLFLLRWLLRTSVRYLCAVAHRVIVHEAVFHRRLIDDYGVVGSHVHVVPHGVVPAVISNGGPGEKTLLVFGYLAWYKGVDIILRAFQQIAAEFSDWQLIIAGGPHPRMKARRRGARLLGELQDLAVPAVRQIEFTGAVRDTKLPALFSNAGICLFPYRLLFSSSGPLGLALAYGRPVILSEALRPLLPEWPHWSVNSPEAWAGSLRRLMADEGLRARASTLARAEAAARTWSVVARETAEVYRLAVDSRHRPHESV